MRLIDADALVKEIKRVYCTGCNDYHGIRCKACATDDALDMVEDALTIDAEPVRHGRWIDMQEDDATEGMWRCSICGDDRYFDIMTPAECGSFYCPNCGARMDGDVNATD